MNSSTVAEMRAIWEKSLHTTDLSLDDDFFDVGGHSLSMVVVQDRITERFGVEIAMDQLFRNATINLMSELVDAASVASSGH
ncbi:acyl carrier protein [Cribrihabitans neustonicus]|uniref:acyl carrier protein n=1 Tax=Cribrihabitans neustonicus TaxID=1429085 RepID=UPI003B5A85C1